MNEGALLTRIDDLEAQINGLMIYIAAKEAGVNLDLEDEKTKAFLKANPARPEKIRQSILKGVPGPHAIAGDGVWEGLAVSKIPDYVEKLKAALG